MSTTGSNIYSIFAWQLSTNVESTFYIKNGKREFLPLEDNVIPYLFDNYHPTLNLHSYQKETGKESSAV